MHEPDEDFPSNVICLLIHSFIHPSIHSFTGLKLCLAWLAYMCQSPLYLRCLGQDGIFFHSPCLLFGDSPDFSITLISCMALCIHSESILISASVSPILLNVFSLGLILFHKAISKLPFTFPWSSGFCC